jgi:hypothetical protein
MIPGGAAYHEPHPHFPDMLGALRYEINVGLFREAGLHYHSSAQSPFQADKALLRELKANGGRLCWFKDYGGGLALALPVGIVELEFVTEDRQWRMPRKDGST